MFPALCTKQLFWLSAPGTSLSETKKTNFLLGEFQNHSCHEWQVLTIKDDSGLRWNPLYYKLYNHRMQGCSLLWYLWVMHRNESFLSLFVFKQMILFWWLGYMVCCQSVLRDIYCQLVTLDCEVLNMTWFLLKLL